MKQLKRRWYLFLALLISIGVLGFGLRLYFQQDKTTTPENALVVRVIDGDTIVLENGERVRYIGIDAPEKGEYYYKESTAANEHYVLNKVVTLVRDMSDRDRSGRLLRYIYVDDILINGALIMYGYAKPAAYPPDLAHRIEFNELANNPKNKSMGVWNPEEGKLPTGPAFTLPPRYTPPTTTTPPKLKDSIIK